MSRNIVRVNKSKDYTVMSNYHLRDTRLSFKAKGIHSYILSLPDDWKVVIEHLKSVSTDGERATRSGIKELYELRYWQKYPVYINGKVSTWITEIYEEPFPEEHLIKSAVIKNGKKIINYANKSADKGIIDADLLCQNAQVDEDIENTTSDLLCQNVDVGNVDVGNAGLLSTNILSTNNTNHSVSQTENIKTEESEKIKGQCMTFYFDDKESMMIESAIESIANKDIRRAKLLNYDMCAYALDRYNEALQEKRIKNKKSYFESILYNSVDEFMFQ